MRRQRQPTKRQYLQVAVFGAWMRCSSTSRVCLMWCPAMLAATRPRLIMSKSAMATPDMPKLCVFVLILRRCRISNCCKYFSASRTILPSSTAKAQMSVANIARRFFTSALSSRRLRKAISSNSPLHELCRRLSLRRSCRYKSSMQPKSIIKTIWHCTLTSSILSSTTCPRCSNYKNNFQCCINK